MTMKPITSPLDHHGVDMAAGIANLGGDEKFYRHLMSELVRIHGDDAARIRTVLDSGDTSLASQIAHALKGAAGSLMAFTVQRLAGELEDALNSDRRELLDQLFPALSEALAHLRTIPLFPKEKQPPPEQTGPRLLPDMNEVYPLLEELLESLLKRRMSALDIMQLVEEKLAGTVVAPEVTLLVEAVDRLEFARAHTLVGSLTSRLNGEQSQTSREF
jgi:HPt (histidine-containing phosphotransfer) domain-containing protein